MILFEGKAREDFNGLFGHEFLPEMRREFIAAEIKVWEIRYDQKKNELVAEAEIPGADNRVLRRTRIDSYYHYIKIIA